MSDTIETAMNIRQRAQKPNQGAQTQEEVQQTPEVAPTDQTEGHTERKPVEKLKEFAFNLTNMLKHYRELCTQTNTDIELTDEELKEIQEELDVNFSDLSDQAAKNKLSEFSDLYDLLQDNIQDMTETQRRNGINTSNRLQSVPKKRPLFLVGRLAGGLSLGALLLAAALNWPSLFDSDKAPQPGQAQADDNTPTAEDQANDTTQDPELASTETIDVDKYQTAEKVGLSDEQFEKIAKQAEQGNLQKLAKFPAESKEIAQTENATTGAPEGVSESVTPLDNLDNIAKYAQEKKATLQADLTQSQTSIEQLAQKLEQLTQELTQITAQLEAEKEKYSILYAESVELNNPTLGDDNVFADGSPSDQAAALTDEKIEAQTAKALNNTPNDYDDYDLSRQSNTPTSTSPELSNSEIQRRLDSREIDERLASIGIVLNPPKKETTSVATATSATETVATATVKEPNEVDKIIQYVSRDVLSAETIDYTVILGDNTWTIAKKTLINLGQPATNADIDPLWRGIVAANPDKFNAENPDLVIKIGDILNIPALESLGTLALIEPKITVANNLTVSTEQKVNAPVAKVGVAVEIQDLGNQTSSLDLPTAPLQVESISLDKVGITPLYNNNDGGVEIDLATELGEEVPASSTNVAWTETKIATPVTASNIPSANDPLLSDIAPTTAANDDGLVPASQQAEPLTMASALEKATALTSAEIASICDKTNFKNPTDVRELFNSHPDFNPKACDEGSAPTSSTNQDLNGSSNSNLAQQTATTFDSAEKPFLDKHNTESVLCGNPEKYGKAFLQRVQNSHYGQSFDKSVCNTTANGGTQDVSLSTQMKPDDIMRPPNGFQKLLSSLTPNGN